MKPKTLDEIRDELATEQCQQIIKEQRAQKKDQFLYSELSDELFWKCGFNASTSHHQKIIADLVSALEYYNHEGWHGPARQALAAYKQIYKCDFFSDF